MEKSPLVTLIFRYGAYWLILVIGFYYFHFYSKRLHALQDAMANSIRLVLPLAEAQNRILQEEIEAITAAYKNERNGKYSARARTTKRLLNNFLVTLKQPAQRVDRIEQSAVLQRQTRELFALADTFSYLCDNDKTLSAELRLLLEPVAHLSGFAENCIVQPEPSLWVNILACQANLMARIAFRFFDRYTGGSKGHYWDPYTPVWASRNLFPKAGEPFEADVFLAGYQQTAVYDITINGEALPTKEGLARYRHTFTTAGKHPLLVRITTSDTLNAARLISEWNFDINVDQRQSENND